MGQAVELLTAGGHLSLEPNDGPRLLAFLGGSQSVTRDQFVEGVGRLGNVLRHLGEAGLTLTSLKLILTSLFERLDLNQDGEISTEEFVAGGRQLGLKLEDADFFCLHRFFASELGAITAESLTQELEAEELLASLQKGSMNVAQERLKWNSLLSLAEVAGDALEAARQGPQAWAERALAGVLEKAEDIADVAEGAADATGLAVSAQSLLHALGSGGAEGIDLIKVAPLATLMCAFLVKVGKDLNELVPRSDMTEDEALLYWGVFHKHGLSQASFNRLLACEGCSWGVAEAGQVLSADEDRCVRIILRGAVALRPTTAAAGAPAVQLPAGFTVGETAFLGGGRLWRQEAVVATEQVVYVSWDFDSLREALDFDPEAASCMTGLLSRSMLANFRLAAGHRGRRRPRKAAKRCNRPRFEHFEEVFKALDLDSDGALKREELARSPDFTAGVVGKMGMPSSSVEFEFERLFAFIAGAGADAVESEVFAERLEQLEDCIKCLEGSDMTVGDLTAVLLRAHCEIDTDGDGRVSLEELATLVRKLGFQLDERQCATLHAYFDVDGDGLVAADEWQEPEEGPQVLAALKDTVESQAERKGLAHSAHIFRRLQNSLQGPEAPQERLHSALAIAWDGVESLCEAASCCVDVAGAGLSVVGIMDALVQHVDGSESMENLGLPLLCLAACSAQTLANLTAEMVTDLKEHEALLYAKAFEKAGVSVSEFRKLMKHGNPRWQSLSPGEAVVRPAASAGSPTLCTVVSGRCEVQGDELGALKKVGSGGFLCNVDLGRADKAEELDSSLAAHAEVPTTTVTWDWELLRPYLERHRELKIKLRRVVATSMAKSFLKAHSLDRH